MALQESMDTMPPVEFVRTGFSPHVLPALMSHTVGVAVALTTKGQQGYTAVAINSLGGLSTVLIETKEAADAWVARAAKWQSEKELFFLVGTRCSFDVAGELIKIFPQATPDAPSTTDTHIVVKIVHVGDRLMVTSWGVGFTDFPDAYITKHKHVVARPKSIEVGGGLTATMVSTAATGLKECAACGAVAPPSRCERCRTTYYCNEQCQRSHWKKGHKHVCRSPGK